MINIRKVLFWKHWFTVLPCQQGYLLIKFVNNLNDWRERIPWLLRQNWTNCTFLRLLFFFYWFFKSSVFFGTPGKYNSFLSCMFYLWSYISKLRNHDTCIVKSYESWIVCTGKKIYFIHLEWIVKHFLNLLTRNTNFQVIRMR